MALVVVDRLHCNSFNKAPFAFGICDLLIYLGRITEKLLSSFTVINNTIPVLHKLIKGFDEFML